MAILYCKFWSTFQIVLVFVCLVSALHGASATNSTEEKEWASTAADRYDVIPDVTYLSVDGDSLKLDIYKHHDSTAPVPVVVYFHGGGWVNGDKDDSTLQLLPYLKMGWAAINVNYRLANVAVAPAAVEDCRCALRWITQNARKYALDLSRVVLTGHSSGGYLALMTGIVTESAGYDRRCPGGTMKVAAIVNWFGITDLGDILAGRHAQSFAAEWLGNRTDRNALASRLSPLSYLRKGLPPIITIHGDEDLTVPYSQATKLHEELSRLGDKNRLLTIHGGKHGWFTPKEDRSSYAKIRAFLGSCGLKPLASD